jgi:hypothetical protein
MLRVNIFDVGDEQGAVAAVNESESERFLGRFQKLGDAQICLTH